MNEEQAILDFFGRAENLSLGLSVAEQMDELRLRMNNQVWRDLLIRMKSFVSERELPWQIELTEDRNASDRLVGLYFAARLEQEVHLRPMVEQQFLGGEWRVYFGLMWSAAPTPELLGLPPVNNLKVSLQLAGFKANESFLAWQWTAFHPRRRDFLLRYSQRPEALLDEMAAILKTMLTDHGAALALANAALQNAPHSTTVSLAQLRKNLPG